MTPSLADLTAFLVREAELLDSWQLDAWLALYAPDGIYWVPIEPGQAPVDMSINQSLGGLRKPLELRKARAK